MRPLVKLKEKRYGRLTILGEYKKIGSYYYVKCLCDCGTIKYIMKSHIVSGDALSCGCYRTEQNILNKTKHGLWKTRIYNTYCNMMKRCYSEKCDKYKEYGARGIKSEWSCFEDFYKDMNPSYEEHVKQYGEKNTTLDRIDNNGNYCKENCRWATLLEQANNKRNTYMVEYMGEKIPITRLSKMYNIKTKTLKRRLKKGWSIEDALTRPLEVHNKKTDEPLQND